MFQSHFLKIILSSFIICVCERRGETDIHVEVREQLLEVCSLPRIELSKMFCLLHFYPLCHITKPIINWVFVSLTAERMLLKRLSEHLSLTVCKERLKCLQVVKSCFLQKCF